MAARAWQAGAMRLPLSCHIHGTSVCAMEGMLVVQPARARAGDRAIARFLDVVTRDAMLRARLRGGEPMVQRVLAAPGGPPDPGLLYRLVEEAAALPAEPVVLDVGCGVGAMIAEIATRRGGTWTGLTFSPLQAERARSVAQSRGLVGAVAVHLCAPDEPPSQLFDSVLAVEALLHCRNPGRVMATLARVLRPGGRLVLVENMVEADAATRRAISRQLRAPGLAPEALWRDRLAKAGLTLLEARDLSPLVPERSIAAIERLANRLGAARRLLPIGDLRRALDARLGALAMERLLREGRGRYGMLTATRSV
jgi:SAM-dependent methyltransferase